MTNLELRELFEAQMLPTKSADQIRKDIEQTANSEGRDADNDDFLKDFWANYCPEDDGNEWVKKP